MLSKPNPTLMSANPSPPSSPRCPRCDSSHTKFCYYNNYSSLQPRHFCKSCRRYWTRGGSLRNVPIGGGCRKNHPKSSCTNRDANLLISAQLRPNHPAYNTPLLTARPNDLLNSSQLYLDRPNDAPPPPPPPPPPIYHLLSPSESAPNLGPNHVIKHASHRLVKDPDEPPHQILFNDPITKSNRTTDNNEETVNTNHHDQEHYYGVINYSNGINWNFMY